MSAGNIQVGFTVWNTGLDDVMNPNGFSMSNTVTPGAVDTWIASNPPNGMTDICEAVDDGNTCLLYTSPSPRD